MVVASSAEAVFSSAVLARNYAYSGGVASLSGASRLALSGCDVLDSAAHNGGFVSFENDAAALATVTLADNTVNGTSAFAGGLYFSYNNSNPFEAPACSGCRLGNSSADSWGPVAATLPSLLEMKIDLKNVDSINAAQYAKVIYFMRDAFGQAVESFPQGEVAVDCVGMQLPDAAAPQACRPSTVRVYDSHGYFDGEGSLSLRLQAPARTRLQLRLTATLPVAAGDAALVMPLVSFVNATIQSCADRNECPPEGRLPHRLVGLIVGVVVGSTTFLILLTAGAVWWWARRLEQRRWREDLAQQHKIVTELAELLPQCTNERSIVDEALHSVKQLYPECCAHMVVAFAVEGEPQGVICRVHVADDQPEEVEKKLLSKLELAAAYVTGDNGESGFGFSDTSIAAVRKTGLSASSRDYARGLAAFSDWSAAVEAGLGTVRAVTHPLLAGPVCAGCIILHFPNTESGSVHGRRAAAASGSLQEISGTIGSALFVRRVLFGGKAWMHLSVQGDAFQVASTLTRVCRGAFQSAGVCSSEWSQTPTSSATSKSGRRGWGARTLARSRRRSTAAGAAPQATSGAGATPRAGCSTRTRTQAAPRAACRCRWRRCTRAGATAPGGRARRRGTGLLTGRPSTARAAVRAVPNPVAVIFSSHFFSPSIARRPEPNDSAPPCHFPLRSRAAALATAQQKQARVVDALRLSSLELDADKMVKQLRRWDLNVWDLGYDELKTLLLHMFRSMQLIRTQSRGEYRRTTSMESVELSATTLSTFIDHVSDHYWGAVYGGFS